VRRLVTAIAAAAALAASPFAPVDTAQAHPTLRIVKLRVLQSNSDKPAKQPLRRDRTYVYEVEYLVGGSGIIRVTRAASVISPERVVAIVRPPATISDPGRYRVSSRIRVGPDDPPGLYTLRYTIAARGDDGHTVTRRKVLRIRFR
jgi:hypothetical protein